VRVSDTATADIVRAAANAGSTTVPSDVRRARLPAVASIFAPAIELDLWRARHLPVETTPPPGRRS
jgi:hypothetical protein